MRLTTRIGAVLAGLVVVPALAVAATIGGVYYAPQYDYRDFFAATDGRNFPVILAGDAFPVVDPDVVARDLLPAMQAAKPRPALTFTYDRPIPPASPDYRLVLVFDPANNLTPIPSAPENRRVSSRARPVDSMSMRSTAGTIGPCPLPRHGHRRTDRPIHGSNSSSDSSSWSSSATSKGVTPNSPRFTCRDPDRATAGQERIESASLLPARRCMCRMAWPL